MSVCITFQSFSEAIFKCRLKLIDECKCFRLWVIFISALTCVKRKIYGCYCGLFLLLLREVHLLMCAQFTHRGVSDICSAVPSIFWLSVFFCMTLKTDIHLDITGTSVFKGMQGSRVSSTPVEVLLKYPYERWIYSCGLFGKGGQIVVKWMLGWLDCLTSWLLYGMDWQL